MTDPGEATAGGDLHELLHRHHADLTAWLADGDREALERFVAAHTEDATVITVDGLLVDVEDLRDALVDSGGYRPGLTIEIVEPVTVAGDPRADTLVVAFLEVQRVGDRRTERHVTAVLVADADRQGWRWRHVHETTVGR